MDLKYWGLKEQPFRPTVSPMDACPSPGHDHALEKMAFALSCREPIHLVTGEHGVGKTTLLRRLAISQETCVDGTAWIACSPNSTTTELLYAILSDLGCTGESLHLASLRARLLDHTVSQNDKKCPTLLICDNAHHLPIPALAELRLLSDLINADGFPYWMILLCGHNSIHDKLADPQLEELRDSLGCVVSLDRLSWEEADAFLRQQLLRAGGTPEAQVSAEAWSLMADIGQGNPRRLNRLARYSFHYAEINEAVQVDAEAVLEAAHDLHMVDEREENEQALEALFGSKLKVADKKIA